MNYFKNPNEELSNQLKKAYSDLNHTDEPAYRRIGARKALVICYYSSIVLVSLLTYQLAVQLDGS